MFRRENSWPPPLNSPDQSEGGLVVALDTQTGKHHPIPGMGRHNHENSIPVPGFGKPVLLSGDDTFTSGPLTGVTLPAGVSVPAQSQLYSYIAPSTDALLGDQGDLWAFVSDTPGVRNYYDVTPGSNTQITGHFIKVPKDIATGRNANGTEIKAADKGFPLPPTNGSWQRDLRSVAPLGIDGPQWVLEYWSDINNVFQFVRIEDIAYDKRPGMANVVYIVDSGRGAHGRPQPGHAVPVHERPRLADGARPERSDEGDVAQRSSSRATTTPSRPSTRSTSPTTSSRRRTASSSPRIRARASSSRPTRPPSERHDGPPLARPVLGTCWIRHPVGRGEDRPGRRRWAHRRRSVARTATSAPGRPPGSSTRPKHSAPDMFLINVQAHTLWVEKAPGDDNNADGQPDFTYKREGGQLAPAPRSRAPRRYASEWVRRPRLAHSSSRVTKPGPPANRQWSTFITRPPP